MRRGKEDSWENVIKKVTFKWLSRQYYSPAREEEAGWLVGIRREESSQKKGGGMKKLCVLENSGKNGYNSEELL